MAGNTKDDISLEEYKSCRDLLKSNIDIMEKSEVYVVGAVAAVAVYCLSSKSGQVVRLCSWLPLIISFLGFVRFIGFNSTIGTLNDYFESIEGQYEIKPMGWTRFYRAKKNGSASCISDGFVDDIDWGKPFICSLCNRHCGCGQHCKSKPKD